MGRTIVCLSFDDGRKDNYRAAKEVLCRYNIQATFNIATAYLDGSIREDKRPCMQEAMSVEEVRELHRLGFEIAGHGDQHLNSIEDVGRGIAKIKEWLGLGENAAIGFASPHSAVPADEIRSQMEEFQKLGIFYFRTGIVNPNHIYRRAVRWMAKRTGSTCFYRWGFADTVRASMEDGIIYSIPVMHGATLKQVVALLKMAVEEGKDCVLMFHSILKKGEERYTDAWSWDYDNFQALCSWLKEMEAEQRLVLCKTLDLVNSMNK